MKNRLIITISDAFSTKSYNVNKIIKKLILWSIITFLIGSIIIFYVITSLNESVKNLEIESLKLTNQNEKYSREIVDKKNYIEELGSELKRIENIIGLDGDEDSTLVQRATLAKLTSAQKLYMLNTIPSGCPMKECRQTSKFGWRIHPLKKKKQFHKGLDLKAKINTEIYAPADGVVKHANKKDNNSFGRTVIIAHNFGFETIFAHLNRVNVKIGDVVKKGQLIAKSGNSGKSNGPHLHYEVHYANKVLDPTVFVDWNMQTYDKLFEKQRRVKWESLVNLIKNQNEIMIQQ
ncbi:MAG: M23 family metallopeptidase [Campylobacterota bacterium]|nr:M23 family metallopeptidase [Campylobacterota bacterium]